MRDVDETAETRKLRRETGTLSRRDMSRSDIQLMGGNEASSGPGTRAGRGGPGQSTAEPPTAAEEIWLCPSVVSLTAAEITAALYAFSELIDEMTNHACKAVVRDELSFIVARYGTAMIEHIAEWLVAGPDYIPWLLNAIGVGPDLSPSADRLAWCREQSLLLLRAEAA